MKNSYEVVVVGSGFGGSVTGCRLALAGRSVAILEKGIEWARTDFPRSPLEVANRGFWKKNKSYGLIEYKAFKRMDVVQGCGVGGGSLHYYNVNLRTPPEIFERPPWPEEVSGPVLDAYYQRAEEMLESKPLEPPKGRKLPLKTTAFMNAARAAGRPVEMVPIAVYSGEERKHPISGIPQDPCDYSGDCMLGCTQQAKQTLDLNYLPLARKNGAEIHPLHEAIKIEPLGEKGFRVHFHRLDADKPGQFEAGSVEAKQVVVAAGTLGSSELLLRCRDFYKTLPALGPNLGMRFSGNGDFILGSTSNAQPRIDPSRGPSITAMADFSTPEHKVFIQDTGFPNPLAWLLEGLIPTSARFRNLLSVAKTYLVDSLGLKNGRIDFEIDRLLRGGATSHRLPYLGMGTDAADGRLRLNKGWIELDWSHKQSRQVFRQIEDGFRELSRQLGGKYTPSPLWRWPKRKLLTAHPLGGCFMGSSAQDSVVDHRGEVWAYPGLFVADGAVIPTALAVNPSLTIAALAERIAQWMIHGKDV